MVTAVRAMIESMTKTSILIVQQQPELQRALQANLSAGSYDVIGAGTGRAAMALAARRPPDAVILDLSLPDVDGVEVITELRHRYRAPIIVLSGRARAGDKVGALDAGADDYVTKPFVMGELAGPAPREAASRGRQPSPGRASPGGDRTLARRPGLIPDNSPGRFAGIEGSRRGRSS